MKGRCLNRLTMEPQYLFSYEKTPRVGLEPTTTRLTAECSTIELSRKRNLLRKIPKKKLRFFPVLGKSKLSEGFVPSKPNTEIFIILLFLSWLSFRLISKSQLNTLLCLHLSPIYLVVFKESIGYLILRGASRLDAFSVYPCRTWLLCHRSDT